MEAEMAPYLIDMSIDKPEKREEIDKEFSVTN